jgi:hypothetical protein
MAAESSSSASVANGAAGAGAPIDAGGMAATNTPSMRTTAAALTLTHLINARYRHPLNRPHWCAPDLL